MLDKSMLPQHDRLINSLRYLCFLIVFTFALSIYFHTDGAMTQDLGRHLILGKIIWEEKSIPGTNLFSYTNPAFPFINHHWGSEIIFYITEKLFSINGLIILKIIIASSAIFILTIYIWQNSSLVPYLISSALTITVMRERTEIRPEIIALLLYSIFLLILYKEKKTAGKLIWIIPLLNIFWVNSHISFILGWSIYFIFIMDRFIVRRMKIKYLILGLLLILSTFINPFGWRGAFYPFSIFSNYGYSIVENQSPLFLEKFMNNPTILYFKTIFLLLIVLTPFLMKNKYYFEIGVAISTGLLSFLTIRHFSFFSLAAMLPLSVGLSYIRSIIITKWKTTSKSNIWKEAAACLIVLGFILYEIFSLLSNNYYISKGSAQRAGLGQIKGMRETVDFFQKHHLTGPIFNNFDIGSYLIYRVYPEERVFVDGRPEAYPESFFKQVYIPIQENNKSWEEASNKYNFQAVIFGHTDATPWGREFVSRISKDPSWKMVYFDDFGVIWVKKGSSNDQVNTFDTDKKIKEYAVGKIQDTKTRDTILRLANFFQLLGYLDLERTASIKANSLN